jgi:biotin operon repressor
LAKSIAEQLGISRERVGSIIGHAEALREVGPEMPKRGQNMNINGPSRLSNFWNFFGAKDSNDFLS